MDGAAVVLRDDTTQFNGTCHTNDDAWASSDDYCDLRRASSGKEGQKDVQTSGQRGREKPRTRISDAQDTTQQSYSPS
jgi:hypothetical protein